MNPKPMWWRALIYGRWLIVSDRMAALIVTLCATQVRLLGPEDPDPWLKTQWE